jgi:hypothetical protein
MQLDSQQTKLLQLKQTRMADAAIAQALGCTANQVQKLWFKLLEQAWEIRNYLVSGTEASTDE